jgi:hypothetical protein
MWGIWRMTAQKRPVQLRKQGLRSFEQLEERRVLTTEGELLTIERSLDISGTSGSLSGTITWNDGTQSAAQVVSQPSAGPLKIRFDYSLDTSGFFSAQIRRDVLQLAADTLISKFADNLGALSPGGVNQWTANFQHPTSGQATQISNLNVAANELVIYVGARTLSGSTLALASIGGYSASGTQAFIDAVKSRGQTGALAATPTDFGPWGGAIAFQSNASWHFGNTTTGLDTTESDFFSAAIHELCHILGFGTAPSWSTNLSGTQFIGNNSRGKYDAGGNVPLDSIKVHWIEGTTDGGKETLMDPTLSKGVRKMLTRLDLAGLQDLGWSLVEPLATIRGTHVYADNGSFDVDVSINGSKIGTSGWSQNVAISNAAPVLQAISNFNVVAGTPLVLNRLGVFTDLGFDNSLDSPPTQERFTYRVEWGDGSPLQTGNAAIETMGSAGTPTKGFFDASHLYTNPGTYTVNVRITDDDGGQAERTFSVNVQAAPKLMLSVSKATVDENAGLRATSLTVKRVGTSTGAVTVNLRTSDTTELRIPASTVIPAGVLEVQVDVEAVDDSLLDGNVPVTITAEAFGFATGTVDVVVADYETLFGALNVTSVLENAGNDAVTWTITRSNSDNSQPLQVQLSNSDGSELSVPATATIPAGVAFVNVPISVLDDSLLDGTIQVSLLASANGYRTRTDVVSVQDVETISLALDRLSLQEKTPQDSVRGVVRLSFSAPTGGYTVQLSPSQTGQLNIPATVTVPAGSNSIAFDVVAIDDYAVEADMSIQLLATGAGAAQAAVDILLEDNDEPLWQNPADRLDTDGNRVLNAIDALVVINNLNRFGSRFLKPGIDSPPPNFIDPNGDGAVTAIDALFVINELNRRGGA